MWEHIFISKEKDGMLAATFSRTVWKTQTPINTSNEQLKRGRSHRVEKNNPSNWSLNYVLDKWLDLCLFWFFFVVFSGWCHFLLTTTKNNCCQSSMAVKPKKEWNFLKIFTASIVTSRLTFCVLKAIFKELNRWQSIPESVKVKKKVKAWKCKPIALTPHFMLAVDGLGYFICRLLPPFIPVTKVLIAPYLF